MNIKASEVSAYSKIWCDVHESICDIAHTPYIGNRHRHGTAVLWVWAVACAAQTVRMSSRVSVGKTLNSFKYLVLPMIMLKALAITEEQGQISMSMIVVSARAGTGSGHLKFAWQVSSVTCCQCHF
eukprot:6186059-Pleurochrysis_carterae.AAC.1